MTNLSQLKWEPTKSISVDTVVASQGALKDLHVGDLITMAGGTFPSGVWRVISIDSDCMITVRPVTWFWILYNRIRRFFTFTIPNAWRRIMKTIFTLAFVLLCSQVASADTALYFKNGGIDIWQNVIKKGTMYCGEKKGIELCEDRANVNRLQTVPDGTDPMEFGTADIGSLQSQSDSMWAAQYDEAEVNAKKASETAADKKRARDRESKVRLHGEDKVSQMERAGNSVR